MRRRNFIALLGGAAAAWPLAASAQQGERVRRIGVLAGGLKTDLEFQARIEAFRQHLQQLGWTEGSNVRIDIRWGAGEVAAVRKQIDPRVKRAGVMRDPASPTGIGLLAAMQGVAPSFGVELSPLSVQKAGDIESTIAGFARASNGGLIVTLSGVTIQHRELIS